MKRTTRISQCLGAATIVILLPLTVKADLGHTGPPMSYGQWSSTLDLNGKAVITDSSAECTATGWTCKTIAEDDGFLYQEVRTADGEIYTRLINIDPGTAGNAATLDFSSETFTSRLERNNNNDWVFADGQTTLGLAAQGIASRQIIQDAANNYVSTAEIQNGFGRAVMGTNDGLSGNPDAIYQYCSEVPANVGNQALIDACAQDLAEQAWSVRIRESIVEADLDSQFSIVIYNDTNKQPSGGPTTAVGGLQSNNQRGKLMDIAQNVLDTTSGNSQRFDLRLREGRSGYEWFCDADGSTFGFVRPCVYDLTKGGSYTLNGTTIDWNASGRVEALWIGSTMGAGFGDNFSYTTVKGNDLVWSGSAFTEFIFDYADNGTTNGQVKTTGQDVLTSSPPAPSGNWPANPFADLNWPLDTANVTDPFSTMPRTAPPSL